MTVGRGMRSVLELPELNIAVFGFLLSFAWETPQSPLSGGVTEARHWETVRRQLMGADGDGAAAARRCYAPE